MLQTLICDNRKSSASSSVQWRNKQTKETPLTLDNDLIIIGHKNINNNNNIKKMFKVLWLSQNLCESSSVHFINAEER